MSYPINFELQNDASTKYLNIVVEFEGTNTMFSLLPTYKRVRWGDPDIYWGMPGLIWGGLLQMQNVKPLLSPDTQLVVDQRVEPEQGRASASTLNLSFVDLQGFMTEFVTPGKYLNEVLGGKLVKIYLGYQNTGFKEDYFVFYRGYVSSITAAPTKVILQLTDANLKRRQQIFKLGKTQTRQLSHNFTSLDVNILTDRITITGHQFKNGNRVQFFTDGVLPSIYDPDSMTSNPIAAASDLYILNPTANDFQLSYEPGGPTIDITAAGSGNHSVYLYGVGPFATQIPVIYADDFIQPILGPNGGYDSSLRTYLKIGDEIMSYAVGGVATEWVTVSRGDRGTLAEDHDIDEAVDNIVELEGNIIDLSLKMMLSGWEGVWKSDIKILKFVQTGHPDIGNVSTAFVLPNNLDAVDEYGLSIGDYIYITGAANPVNNGQRIVTGFLDFDTLKNNIVLVDVPFVIEAIPTPAVFSTRSQYDVYPKSCGSRLRPIDVDVAGWVKTRQQFLTGPTNDFRIFVTKPQSGKEFIESQFLLPAGAYSVTKFGRLSIALTKPPLAGENLVVLDEDTIIEPQNTVVRRGLNNRRFFNEIQYFYDFDDSGESTNKISRLDTNSLSKMDTSSVLPIQAQGLRTDLGAETFVDKRLDFVLKRYKDAAIEITLKTNWKAASMIEISDIVALYDNGDLKITNLETGERDMGSVLLEVIQRQIDIKSGTATLTLLSQTGYQVSDRFAGIAPSSLVGVGSSTFEVVIKDSFGSIYPFNEKKKWEPIIGDRIRIHSQDYSFDESRILTGFVPGSSYRMLIDSPLSSAPLENYIVDCDVYPDNTNQADQAKTKLLFSFITPTLTVVSGISTSQFTVSVGDSAKIFPNLPIKIHNDNYSLESSEAEVDNVTGVIVTLKTPIEFIPSAGQKIELIGYKDGLGPYRIL